MKPTNATIHVGSNVSHASIDCLGDWTLSGISEVDAQIANLPVFRSQALTINGEGIVAMDSVGAWVLHRMIATFQHSGKQVSLSGFKDEYQSILSLVQTESQKIAQPPSPLEKQFWLENIGKKTSIYFAGFVNFLRFLGEVCVMFWQCVGQPRRIQWRSFLKVIYETGYQALPIVGLLTFLIGVVLAYQMGQELKLYGANIYIVSLLGIGILQEFAPLIAAIIVAGRTSSAFTAQIGAMKINEEIDALSSMGLSPIDYLVLPKIFGLIISLPLLVVWADIFGILGGMVVSNYMLDINFYSFFVRFPSVIDPLTFINGLIKAPVFAAIIAMVGSLQGLSVSSNADSLGRQTTKSVVQSIFFVIVADAIFSMIMPWQNI